jgi:hypothetical protein
MSELQKQIWNALCKLNGEEVARLFADYYGLQLLDEDFKEFIEEEGVLL